MVLAGGLGTRLRPVVSDRPKAIAPVLGRPFLCYLLEQLAAAGLRRVVLCTGYLGDEVRAALGDRYGPLSLVYSQEPFELNTGGAIRRASPLLESDPALIVNGDSWCDLDPLTFLSWHRARGAAGSIWLTGSEKAGREARYGLVETDEQGRVRSFEEKGARPSGSMNAGAYLLSRRLLAEIPADRAVPLEREVFPRWIGRGLYGYRGGGRFLDIGTPEGYRQAPSFIARTERREPVESSARRDGPRVKSRSASRHYVVLDRDGTLNAERRYLSDPDQVELLPGVIEGLKRLQALGLGLVVITNQSAVGRGYFDAARLTAIHDRLTKSLLANGVTLDAIYYCPHKPEEKCECRKPGPALMFSASRDLGFRAEQAFVVGDKPCDLEMGKRASACTILVGTGYGKQTLRDASSGPDFAVDDLPEAAQLIEFLLGRHPAGT